LAFVGAVAALWSLPVVGALVIETPLGVNDPRVLVGELLGVASARYMSYCPVPLLVYFFAAQLMRHPLALVLAAGARGSLGAGRGWKAVHTTLLKAWCVGILLLGGGALAVGLATGADTLRLRWTVELAQLTVLAGLPCLATALCLGVVVKRSATFWILTPLILAIFALFSIGLHGDRIAPVFPGRIEMALTSGDSALRSRGTMGALGWVGLGWLLAITAGSQLSLSRLGGALRGFLRRSESKS
jgi:hypothetical protein